MFSPGYTICIKDIKIPVIYFKIFCASYLLNHAFENLFWKFSYFWCFIHNFYVRSTLWIFGIIDFSVSLGGNHRELHIYINLLQRLICIHCWTFIAFYNFNAYLCQVMCKVHKSFFLGSFKKIVFPKKTKTIFIYHMINNFYIVMFTFI